MNQHLVATFASRIENVLGDANAFPTLFDEINRHPDIRQLEAAALAKAIVGRVPTGTSRRDALARIWSRHASAVGSQARRLAA